MSPQKTGQKKSMQCCFLSCESTGFFWRMGSESRGGYKHKTKIGLPRIQETGKTLVKSVKLDFFNFYLLGYIFGLTFAPEGTQG